MVRLGIYQTSTDKTGCWPHLTKVRNLHTHKLCTDSRLATKATESHSKEVTVQPGLQTDLESEGDGHIQILLTLVLNIPDKRSHRERRVLKMVTQCYSKALHTSTKLCKNSDQNSHKGYNYKNSFQTRKLRNFKILYGCIFCTFAHKHDTSKLRLFVNKLKFKHCTLITASLNMQLLNP